MKKDKKLHLPPVGLRIVKSAVGVFLCYIINMLRGGAGIVFYSQLAVLWCMQDYVWESKAKAKQRAIGTFCGALYGLVALVLFHQIPASIMTRSYFSELFYAIVVSLFIVVILYTTVVINKRQASYFSCVVFLSIVVNHAADINPYLFVWNRFLDTMIGILLGVLVNSFTLPREYHRDILFLSGLDDTLLSENDNLTGYSRVELNRMIDAGALFTISTMRTPASLMEPLRDIHLKLPVIVMDGAALYDIQEKKYIREYVISYEYSCRLIDFFDAHRIPYFANVIVDDLLVIYYQETDVKIYNELIQSLRRSPYRNYVNRRLPVGESVVYFMLLDKTEKIHGFYADLKKSSFYEKLKILCYESNDYPGYSYIKIYNHNAEKKNMLCYLMSQVHAKKVVSFGTIEGQYTHLIENGDSNQVVKIMKKEFEPIRKISLWHVKRKA
ncbi:MAG: HAD hydrolase family protein [Agathobacter sp.]